MDYISAFKTLKTNNKYVRNSPHKAIMLLTIIEMFERNLLNRNEIVFNDELCHVFNDVWSKTLPNEETFYPNIHFPFWYLQSEGFWHIVPVRGQEEPCRKLWESREKPSEKKIKELVQYVELDGDLYFKFTLASERSCLKRALLETYTDLPKEKIDEFSISEENNIDYSQSAIREYEQLLQQTEHKKPLDVLSEENSIADLSELSEDIQLQLAIEYYRFLKSNPIYRESIRESFSSIENLYFHIRYKPYRREDLPISMVTLYDIFLSNLRINLIAETDSDSLINAIDTALAILRNEVPETQEEITEIEDNKKDITTTPVTDQVTVEETIEAEPTVAPFSGNEDIDEFYKLLRKFDKSESRERKHWTEDEDWIITMGYYLWFSPKQISSCILRTENAIKARWNQLGLVDYDYQTDRLVDKEDRGEERERVLFSSLTPLEKGHKLHDMTEGRSMLIDNTGLVMYRTSGSLQFFHGKYYRFYRTNACMSVNEVKEIDGKWTKGELVYKVLANSPLYRALQAVSVIEDDTIQDFVQKPHSNEYRICVEDIWYDKDGNITWDYNV